MPAASPCKLQHLQMTVAPEHAACSSRQLPRTGVLPVPAEQGAWSGVCIHQLVDLEKSRACAGRAPCMRASRIMKLVAHVSSSSSRQLPPSSSASTMLAAWLVLPLASGELKLRVSLPGATPGHRYITLSPT